MKNQQQVMTADKRRKILEQLAKMHANGKKAEAVRLMTLLYSK